MYGRYMNVSNRTCVDEGNLANSQQSQGTSKESTRTRQIMSNNRAYQSDGRGEFEQEEAHEEIKEFQRKQSFQVMGDYGGLGIEENDDIPRRREPCRFECAEDNDNDDDETAKEIMMLMKNKTFSSEQGNHMLESFQRRRNVGGGDGDFDESRRVNSRRGQRSFQTEGDDEQAEEIRELMRNQTLTTHEGESRLQSLQSMGNGHRAGRQLTSSDKPCEIHVDGLPLNWNRDEVMSHSMFRLIELNKGDPECDQIYQDMEESGLEVVKVERLQNLDSWEKFQSEVKHMARRRNPDDDLNIKYLYHGTSVDKTCICEEGLDQRLSRMGFFGKGIYFSDNPLKCVNYVGSSDAKGESYLLKCRVILGDQKKYRKGEYKTTLKREPEKEIPKAGSWKFYDSVMGCPKDYNEYVIYENRRAMIDYIITFKINQLGQNTLRERLPSPIFDNQGRETGFVESQPLKFSGNADDHFDRISQVREAIRRKRCEERGQDYIPPDSDKQQQDKAMWDRLQRLHNVDASTLPSLQEKTDRMRHAASEPQFQVEDLEGAFTESATNSTMFPHSQSFSLGHDADPCDEDVEAVMKSLIAEFREVTDCGNSETARHYIDKCQMNINQAIVCYYEDLP